MRGLGNSRCLESAPGLPSPCCNMKLDNLRQAQLRGRVLGASWLATVLVAGMTVVAQDGASITVDTIRQRLSDSSASATRTFILSLADLGDEDPTDSARTFATRRLLQMYRQDPMLVVSDEVARTRRGGSFPYGANVMRSAHRGGASRQTYFPSQRHNVGFRVARTIVDAHEDRRRVEAVSGGSGGAWKQPDGDPGRPCLDTRKWNRPTHSGGLQGRRRRRRKFVRRPWPRSVKPRAATRHRGSRLPS